MKTLRIFPLVTLFLAIAGMSVAQTKTETWKVSGECGMCKKKIEKAAKDAGTNYALWNVNNKVLRVKYNNASANSAKIQQKIAGVGYDTPDFKATDEAYNNLDACCQYERDTDSKVKNCCTGKCEMKDGKCANEVTCKEKGCCKDASCCSKSE